MPYNIRLPRNAVICIYVSSRLCAGRFLLDLAIIRRAEERSPRITTDEHKAINEFKPINNINRIQKLILRVEVIRGTAKLNEA